MGLPAEYLRTGGDAVVIWLTNILNGIVEFIGGYPRSNKKRCGSSNNQQLQR